MATTEERCPNGHFYNPAKFSSCPHCGVSGIDLGPTVPVGRSAQPYGASGMQPTEPVQQAGVGIGPTVPIQETRTAPLGGWGSNSGEQATVAWYPSHMSQDSAHGSVNPVVGWLVCVEGPDRGRDFRIKAEKNFIGRSTAMDICISGDPRISRENHAIVAFEPRNTEFRLYPGDARGLVYLNNKLVDVPSVLQPYDEIEVGDTHLLFVPFCGERFKWAEK